MAHTADGYEYCECSGGGYCLDHGSAHCVHLCPLHSSAPELLEAAQAAEWHLSHADTGSSIPAVVISKLREAIAHAI